MLASPNHLSQPLQGQLSTIVARHKLTSSHHSSLSQDLLHKHYCYSIHHPRCYHLLMNMLRYSLWKHHLHQPRPQFPICFLFSNLCKAMRYLPHRCQSIYSMPSCSLQGSMRIPLHCFRSMLSCSLPPKAMQHLLHHSHPPTVLQRHLPIGTAWRPLHLHYWSNHRGCQRHMLHCQHLSRWLVHRLRKAFLGCPGFSHPYPHRSCYLQGLCTNHSIPCSSLQHCSCPQHLCTDKRRIMLGSAITALHKPLYSLVGSSSSSNCCCRLVQLAPLKPLLCSGIMNHMLGAPCSRDSSCCQNSCRRSWQ